jgi:peptide chain release factor 2
MRERQQLEDAIKAYSELESGLNDNLDLIALGEEEGDNDIVAEAESAL